MNWIKRILGIKQAPKVLLKKFDGDIKIVKPWREGGMWFATFYTYKQIGTTRLLPNGECRGTPTSVGWEPMSQEMLDFFESEPPPAG